MARGYDLVFNLLCGVYILILKTNFPKKEPPYKIASCSCSIQHNLQEIHCLQLTSENHDRRS
ncbi:Protein of unknown function [Pyronema omphalodes CBS 100304]|uniref:Uncharacterized protein n=1 Tax=Pyronema omphalodes (strain CBS 100304) TaxID=1076935 RepID=U4LL20_PYROM|nr:Protein of unknown function [Pyronema omphalodes CBS 100304]